MYCRKRNACLRLRLLSSFCFQHITVYTQWNTAAKNTFPNFSLITFLNPRLPAIPGDRPPRSNKLWWTIVGGTRHTTNTANMTWHQPTKFLLASRIQNFITDEPCAEFYTDNPLKANSKQCKTTVHSTQYTNLSTNRSDISLTRFNWFMCLGLYKNPNILFLGLFRYKMANFQDSSNHF